MSKLSGIRVFGGRVNSKQSYVDYNIVGTDEEGQIHLENVNDATDTAIWTNEDVQSAFEDEVAVNGDDIPVPADPGWKTLDDLTDLRSKNTYNAFAQDRLEDAQRDVFLALVEEGKDA